MTDTHDPQQEGQAPGIPATPSPEEYFEDLEIVIEDEGEGEGIPTPPGAHEPLVVGSLLEQLESIDAAERGTPGTELQGEPEPEAPGPPGADLAPQDEAPLPASFEEDMDGEQPPPVAGFERRSRLPLAAAAVLMATIAVFAAYRTLAPAEKGRATDAVVGLDPVGLAPRGLAPMGPAPRGDATAERSRPAADGTASSPAPARSEGKDRKPLDLFADAPAGATPGPARTVPVPGVSPTQGTASQGSTTPRRPLIASSAPPPRSHAGSGDAEVQRLEKVPLAPGEIIVALKNGNTFHGVLKSATPESLTLRVYNGEITLGADDLSGILPPGSIEYRPAASFPEGFVQFANGNRMYGRIILATKERVIVDLSGARLVFPRPAVEIDIRDLSMVRPAVD